MKTTFYKAIAELNDEFEKSRITRAQEALGRGNFELIDVDEQLNDEICSLMNDYGRKFGLSEGWWMEYGTAEDILRFIVGRPAIVGTIYLSDDVQEEMVEKFKDRVIDRAERTDDFADEGGSFEEEIEGDFYKEIGGKTFYIDFTVYYCVTGSVYHDRGYWEESWLEPGKVYGVRLDCINVTDEEGDLYQVENIEEVKSYFKEEEFEV